MKKVYFYDNSTKEFAGYDVIDDAAEIPANATTIEPTGLYAPTWNKNKNSWDSLTKEEWNQKHPVQASKPTQDQQTLSDLTKQVMQLQAAIAQQQKVNASLTKRLMNLNKGGE